MRCRLPFRCERSGPWRSLFDSRLFPTFACFVNSSFFSKFRSSSPSALSPECWKYTSIEKFYYSALIISSTVYAWRIKSQVSNSFKLCDSLEVHSEMAKEVSLCIILTNFLPFSHSNGKITFLIARIVLRFFRFLLPPPPLLTFLITQKKLSDYPEDCIMRIMCFFFCQKVNFKMQNVQTSFALSNAV